MYWSIDKYVVKTYQLICRANKLTGFYMAILAFNELMP